LVSPRTYLAAILVLFIHSLSAQCLVSYSWDYSPQLVDGQWGNEEEVQICLTIDDSDWQGGNRYIHAIVPSFGNGWDQSSLEYVAPQSCSSDGGYWAWYDSPVTSEASNLTHGPGFYYESPHGGTDPDNPGDNFGDRCLDGLQLDFCFTISTLSFEDCVPGLDLNITVNTLSDDESGGSFLSPLCDEDEDALFEAGLKCCDAQAGPDLDLAFCSDQSLTSINDYLNQVDSGTWYYADIDSSPLGDSLFFQPGSDPVGTYLYVVSDTSNNCQDIAFIEISSQSGYDAGADSLVTICQSGGIVYLYDFLGSSVEAGGTWTGPDGLAYQEPFNPSTALAGEYTYGFPAIGSCPAAEATITVELVPGADAGENTMVTLCSCQEALDLTDLLDGSPQQSGTWTYEDGTPILSEFDPATDSAGTFIYSIQNANCADAATLTLQVTQVGDVGIGGEYRVCDTEELIDLFDLLSGEFDMDGQWIAPDGTLLSSSLITPSSASDGAYTYDYPCVTCGEQSVLDLQFIPTPTISIDGEIIQCVPSSFEVEFTSSVPGLTYELVIEDDLENEYLFSEVGDGDMLTLSSPVSTAFSLSSATVNDHLHCDVELLGSVQYTLNPPPFASLAGNIAICQGQSVDLTPDLEGNGPFLLEILNTSSGITFLSDTMSDGQSITVFPTVNTSYQITSIWDSSDSVCTSEGIGLVNIQIAEAPSASILGGGEVCGGSPGQAVVSIDGIWAEYDISIEASFGEYMVSGVSDGDTVTFPVPNSLEYCLSDVQPIGTEGCETILSDTCMLFEVLPNLITYSLTIDCDPVTQLGTISFTIQGGSGTYAVNGDMVDGNVYTSTPLPNGTEFSFEVTDENGCSTTRSGLLVCECLESSAGVFPEANDTLSACLGQSLTIQYDDETELLDFNDVRSFIIHDGQADIIGNILYYTDDLSSGLNYNTALNTDQVYWVTAIVANETTDGTADANDVCLSTTMGVAILFRSSPSATLMGSSAICAGEQASFEIEFTGNSPWAFDLGLEASYFSSHVATESPYTIVTSSEGEYTVMTLQDEFCPGTTAGSVQVSVQELPEATLGAGGQFCEGSGNGPQLELQGSAPWTLDYAIDGAPQQIVLGNSTDVIPVFESGTYSLVQITDANCHNTANGSVLVDMMAAPNAEFLVGTPVCEGDSVQVTVQFSGQGPWDIDYSINGESIDTLHAVAGHSFYVTQSSAFQLLYLMDQQCSAFEYSSGTATVYPIPAVDVEISESQVCAGSPVDLSISTLSGSAVQVGLNIGGEDQSVLINTEYNSTFLPYDDLLISVGPVLDQATNCRDTNRVYLETQVIQYPLISISSDPDLCSGDTLQLSSIAEPDVTYQWTSENGSLSAPYTASSLFSMIVEGPFSEVETIQLSASRNGCINESSTLITVDPLPEVDFNYNPVPVTAVNPVINLYNLSTGNNSYIWTFEGDTISLIQTISWLLPEDIADEYEICLEATSLNAGCTSTECQIVEVVGEMSFYIPNSFSPDGDGLNDEFGPVIRNADIDFYEMVIYDRGGSKVYSADNPRAWWNGQENNVGKRSRSGVYNYIITTRDRFQRDLRTIRGSVALIR
jgi:hypothetical protein